MSLLESSAISLKTPVKSTGSDQAGVSILSNKSEMDASEKPFNQHFQQEIENQMKSDLETVDSSQTADQIIQSDLVVRTEIVLEEGLSVDVNSDQPEAEIPVLLSGNALPAIEAESNVITKQIAESAPQTTIQIIPESSVLKSNLPKSLLHTQLIDNPAEQETADMDVLSIEMPEWSEESDKQLTAKHKPQFEVQLSAKSELNDLVKVTKGTVIQTTVASTVTDASSKTSGMDTVTQQLQLNAPLQQKQWGNEFAQRISMLVNNGQQQVAEMRLNPARLGSIGVRIQIEDDKANISFLTSHQSVKEAIEVSLPRLKDQLEQQGLDLGDVDVSARDSEQADTDSDTEFGQFKDDLDQLNTEKNENTEMLETLINFENNDGVSVFV